MYIIGISGLSGSGKSSISRAINDRFPGQVSILEHDMYYHSRAVKPVITNFDHPDALDTDLMIAHIGRLRENEAIERPIYDFKTSDRINETVTIQPHPILIVEGLLVFCIPELMPLFDLRIYVDVPLDIAIIRRLKRDHVDRGRTVKSIIEQYERTVRDAAIHAGDWNSGKITLDRNALYVLDLAFPVPWAVGRPQQTYAFRRIFPLAHTEKQRPAERDIRELEVRRRQLPHRS